MLSCEAAIVYQEPGDSWKQIVEQANGRPTYPRPALISPTVATGDQNSNREAAATGRTPTSSQTAASATSTIVSAQNLQQQQQQQQQQGGGSFRKAAQSREQNTNASAANELSGSSSASNEYSSYPVGRSPLVNLTPGAPSAEANPNLAAPVSEPRGTLPSRSAGLGFVLGAVSGAHHRQPLAPNRSALQAAAPFSEPASEQFYDPAYDLDSTDM